jgi:hypothetical protein
MHWLGFAFFVAVLWLAGSVIRAMFVDYGERILEALAGPLVTVETTGHQPQRLYWRTFQPSATRA